MGTGPESNPSISWDGKRLVHANGTQNLECILFDLSAGSSAIIGTSEPDYFAGISPDGGRIVYASHQGEGGSMNLWRVAVDESTGRPAGEPEPLTTPAGFAAHPTLSADGRRLVVRNPGARTERVRDLAVMDADGRVVERARTASPYLLPGAWRAWPLEPAEAAAPTGDASVARGDSPSGARRTIDPQALRFVTATTDAGGLRVALPRAP